MNTLLLSVALFCFRGDGSPLSDVCVSAWEADTVIECATQGDTGVPLHTNTGTANPGPGFVRFFSTHAISDGRVEVAELAAVRFESRGAIDHGGYDEAVYTVGPEDGLVDGMESCSCHTRSVFPEAACEAAAG
jgi:hypothetical protein